MTSIASVPKRRSPRKWVFLLAFLCLSFANKVTSTTSFLVICTVDGNISVLDALKGSPVGGFSSGRPLVEASQKMGTKRMVPGLDGRLYVSEESDGLLQPLELTVLEVLQNPVKTCNSDQEDCGIVTATKSTSLFALDATTGQLVWHQAPNGSLTTTSNEAVPTVLLQREDALVQQLSTESGRSVWNVTLGTVQALEFGDSGDQLSGVMLPENSRQVLMEQYSSILQDSLPDVLFGPDGTSLTAVRQGRRLWKQDFGIVVASAFGLQDKTWKPLTVLEDIVDERLLEIPVKPTTVVTAYQHPYSLFQPWWKRLDRLMGDFFFTRWRPQPLFVAEMTLINPKKQIMAPLRVHRHLFPPRQLALPSEVQNYSQRPPLVQNGLFLTWPVVVALLFVVSVFATLVFRLVYLKKKDKWLSILRQMESGEERAIIQRSQSTPAIGLNLDLAPLSLHHANTVNGGFMQNIAPREEFDSKVNATNPLSATARMTTESSTPSQQGVRFLVDGIPLVKYNRYESEFTEVIALGKGGFGTVFCCRNTLDGRDYAIKKVILKYDSQLPEQEFSQRLQRTLREVKSLALLDHPNIVRYYTAWLELAGVSSDSRAPETSTDYYLTSAHKNATNDFDDSVDMTTSHRPRQSGLSHLRNNYNPLGGAGGWNGGDESLSRLVPGIPAAWDDVGFTFERSEASKTQNPDVSAADDTFECDPSGQGFFCRRHASIESSIEESQSASNWSGDHTPSKSRATQGERSKTSSVLVKHVLYIQMQFCSQKTLANFLGNEEARKGPSGGDGVDIPYALSLFLEVAEGVKHVHSQGLIHRDLKPNNCFIDDTGVVKVGDFGLSRGSGDSRDEAETPAAALGNGEITAGVGTRSYASPEQMQGSDYDASTDVYSLGIMLFELCYPMYTKMERNIMLTRLRNHELPADWLSDVKPSFPILHALLLSMISLSPTDRPTAETVAQRISSILEGFTISSLDNHSHEGAILLRVETKPREDVLRHTIQLLKEAASPDIVEIAQYGLRSGADKAIMEFAISSSCDDRVALGRTLVTRMGECQDVLLIRQVSTAKYS